ncbi:MAG: MarR family transcriptional regulator [Treponema sp.]|nr:MarR family transcriptional regulator [Treponema sp.]
MEQDLIDHLIQSIFRFKQIEMTFRGIKKPSAFLNSVEIAPNISMAEIAVLKGIESHIFDSGKLTIPDLLCISRAAVSQMLTVMEQKGFITRDINKTNRRKHTLSLTEKGRTILAEQKGNVENLFTEIIDQFGEKETKQLIKLSGRFMDIIEKIKMEVTTDA